MKDQGNMAGWKDQYDVVRDFFGVNLQGIRSGGQAGQPLAAAASFMLSLYVKLSNLQQ